MIGRVNTGGRSGGGMELLWENPSPTASMIPQIINVDLSKYSFFLLISNRQVDSPAYISTIITKNATYLTQSNLGGKLVIRAILITDTTLDIKSGAICDTYASQTTNNSYCVPLKLYGII